MLNWTTLNWALIWTLNSTPNWTLHAENCMLSTPPKYWTLYAEQFTLNWTELNWTELNWTELNWTELNWTELNWTAELN
jgi:hypothetical protein